MLKCLNCGTPCEDGAAQCHQCRMKGRFKKVPVEDAQTQNQLAVQDENLNVCRNCGASLLANTEKCPVCKMPFSGNKPDLSGLNGKPPTLGKTGFAGIFLCKPFFHPFKIEKQWLAENINFSTLVFLTY